MQNDNTIFFVGSILIVTYISICSGLRKKQIEVDSVIKEHKSHKKSDIEIIAQNNNPSDDSPFNKAETSETFDPEVLIDWNLLQNYSDHLGSWISQFELVIDTYFRFNDKSYTYCKIIPWAITESKIVRFFWDFAFKPTA